MTGNIRRIAAVLSIVMGSVALPAMLAGQSQSTVGGQAISAIGSGAVAEARAKKSRVKTVKVKTYRTKKGTRVKAHKRARARR